LQEILFNHSKNLNYDFNLQKIYILLFICCTTTLLTAQTVTITGTKPVDIGCEYKYTANISNVPNTWLNLEYEWQATFIGPSGKMRYVSSYNSLGNPVFTTTSNFSPVLAKTNELWATWDGSAYPTNVQVIFRIKYRLPDNSIGFSSNYNTSPASFPIKGIPTNVTLFGPAAVQRCCPSNITYTVVNQGSTNSFDQVTLPTGWTLISQSGNTFTVQPNASSGGTVSCRVGITTACPAIYRTASIAVTRNDADISIIANEFPLQRICPNTSYTYKINPVCGASSYGWQFPTGWTITSGGSSATVTVTTGASPQSGNIIATANFSGCTSVSKATAVNPLTGAPPTPVFNPFFNNYHCDAWYICRNGGTIQQYLQNEAQTYTYTVSSPWRFINSLGQSVNTLTLAFNEQPPLISLPSGVQRTSGTYTVRANNCLGSSAVLSTRFTREFDCWCDGTFPYPYPNGVLNPCLNPPTNCGDVVPLRVNPSATVTEIKITKNAVFPNPAKSNVQIETTEKGAKLIRITSQNGKVVSLTNTVQQRVSIDVSNWVTGMYLVAIITNNKTIFTHKLIVNK